ncbi:MAG: DUF4397 domain-containing protein [Chitinophagaceae bacterium]|nr:DUF4397 domain-containing protein [Chitinophagaceae bacterium]
MRKYKVLKALALPLAVAGIFVACKKEGLNDTPEVSPSANVLVVHAAPVATGYPTLDVFVDTARFTAAALAYLGNNQATGITGNLLYAPVIADDYELNVRPSTTPGVKVLNTTTSLAANSNYSFFIYDTLSATTSQFKLLRLTDDLTPPADTSMSKVRFLHLAPNAPAYDVTMIRLVGTAETDSITLPARSYIGNSAPNEATLSAFTAVKGGIYRVRLKLAGTSTVAATINNAATNFLNFAKSKAYTVFITGTAKGQALALRSVRHF